MQYISTLLFIALPVIMLLPYSSFSLEKAVPPIITISGLFSIITYFVFSFNSSGNSSLVPIHSLRRLSKSVSSIHSLLKRP
ncbi:hypothetical protein [uncultured Clostridium sp.]|uniref:hypothetical protein n=1 Tax=uncultured Clostridium sp. TaxID=59620 RepID=UPI00261D5DB6|nr:hypothetical protein [uncultured Clostridium sp.]